VGIPGGVLMLSILFYFLGKREARKEKTAGVGAKYAAVKPEGTAASSENGLEHELGERGQERDAAGAGSAEYQGFADRLKHKLPGFKPNA
jgi:hypothetical protein